MKGSRTRLRKVLPEREREEAAVPEAIERLISRGPPAGSGIPFEAWRSWHRYGSLPVRPRSFGIPVPTIAAGWALIAASWMRARDKPTVSPSGRSFCDQYARDRGSAETVPSSSRRALPGRKLQFTNPFISSPTTKTP